MSAPYVPSVEDIQRTSDMTPEQAVEAQAQVRAIHARIAAEPARPRRRFRRVREPRYGFPRGDVAERIVDALEERYNVIEDPGAPRVRVVEEP